MTAELRAYAREAAARGGIEPDTFVRQIQQESGFNPQAFNAGSQASGIAQIIERWHPGVNVWDARASLDYAARWMGQLVRQYGSYRDALIAYNWGPGNLAKWYAASGSPAELPDETRHYLDAILGQDWREPADTIGGNAQSGIVYEDFRDPEPAGRFSKMPKGIILHGSRSGRAGNPKDQEYLGTARYEVSNPAGLGWNATIGEGKVAVHLDPREWGWNARAASDDYLAVEIAQATVDEPVTDRQVDALADWIRTRVLPVWPRLPLHFPSHAEVERSGETGQIDGKSDVFPIGDARMDKLRTRLMARLQTTGGGKVTEEEAAALRAENARLKEQVGGFVNALAFLGDDQGDKLQAVVNELRRVREQYVGPRP